jgi:hypothetical protein
MLHEWQVHKDFEGSRHDLSEGAILAMRLGKFQNTSARIAGNSVKIWTTYLPNTSHTSFGPFECIYCRNMTLHTVHIYCLNYWIVRQWDIGLEHDFPLKSIYLTAYFVSVLNFLDEYDLPTVGWSVTVAGILGILKAAHKMNILIWGVAFK